MITGRDLIALAGNLAVNPASGSPEARFRSAISRAYYGAFHIAAAFLADCEKGVPENSTGHELAYRRLFNTQIPAVVEAARNLNDLRRERIQADYKLRYAGLDSQQNAKDKVQMAELVRTRLQECLAEPIRTKVVAALRAQQA